MVHDSQRSQSVLNRPPQATVIGGEAIPVHSSVGHTNLGHGLWNSAE